MNGSTDTEKPSHLSAGTRSLHREHGGETEKSLTQVREESVSCLQSAHCRPRTPHKMKWHFKGNFLLIVDTWPGGREAENWNTFLPSCTVYSHRAGKSHKSEQKRNPTIEESLEELHIKLQNRTASASLFHVLHSLGEAKNWYREAL